MVLYVARMCLIYSISYKREPRNCICGWRYGSTQSRRVELHIADLLRILQAGLRRPLWCVLLTTLVPCLGLSFLCLVFRLLLVWRRYTAGICAMFFSWSCLCSCTWWVACMVDGLLLNSRKQFASKYPTLLPPSRQSGSPLCRFHSCFLIDIYCSDCPLLVMVEEITRPIRAWSQPKNCWRTHLPNLRKRLHTPNNVFLWHTSGPEDVEGMKFLLASLQINVCAWRSACGRCRNLWYILR